MAQTVNVTLKLPSKQYQRLFEAGKRWGYQPTVYAQLLFDAAFAARVGLERGEPSGDEALDEQVKAVMCLAGQFDTKAISKATGVPEPRVVKILDGFRQVARGPR
jgi:hypothetical protein